MLPTETYLVAGPSGVVHDTRSLSVDETGIFARNGCVVSSVEEVLEVLHENALEDLLYKGLEYWQGMTKETVFPTWSASHSVAPEASSHDSLRMLLLSMWAMVASMETWATSSRLLSPVAA